MIKLLIAFVFGVGLSITGWTAVENYSQEPEALGALSTFTSAQLATGASNGYILSTNGTANSWIVNSGGGGGGGSSLWAYTTATGVLSPIIASTSNHARITGSSFHATSTATSSVIALLDVTRLTNLTSNGFVKTGSANGTLSIDTTTYESGLTAGDGLTRTANDFDFDGGTAPAGELGGTWASPTVDAEITTLEELSDVGTFTQATGDVIYWDGDSWENTATTTWDTNTTYTAGDGLTLTATDFDCDTASGSVFGCLSSANWTTFNDKADLSSSMTGTFDGNNFAGGAVATGDLLYGASAGSIAELTIGSNGQILTIAGGLPAWVSTSTMPLGGDVTGTLSATVVGDNSHSHDSTTISGIDISADTNLTAGDCITLTGDDLDVDDCFLLNNGDVGTGVYDFGGATSFEIVNGAGCTVDAIGEMCLDVTVNAIKVATSTTAAAPIILPSYRPIIFNIASSTWGVTTTAEYATLDFKERVTAGRCYTDAGTLIVRVGDGTNWSNQTSITTSTTTVTFTSNNLFNAAGEKVIFQIGTPASSPTRINCAFRGVYETP